MSSMTRWGRSSSKFRVERALLVLFSGIGASLLVAVAYTGQDYYLLSRLDRLYSDEHQIFGTTGSIGLLSGALAAAFFLSNFAYLLRRRISLLSHWGTMRSWLDWHIVSAILGSGFVAAHANFTLQNHIARTIVYALAVLLVTGVIGRYFLGFVPRTVSGQDIGAAEFEEEVLTLLDEVRDKVLHDERAVLAMQALIDEIESEESLAGLRQLRRRVRRSQGWIRDIEQAMKVSAPDDQTRGTRELKTRLRKLGIQAAMIHWTAQLMHSWRALHRTFALLLLTGTVAHISISLYYGYGAFWQ